VHRGLICLSLLVGILGPAGYAVAATPKPPAGSGGIGVRLVVPAALRNDPHANSWIVERVAPGTTVRRRVEIINSTRSTEDVAVYPAAANLGRGKFGFAPGYSRNELSGWTSVSREVLRLSPGSSAFATVTIHVPKRASSGARYAVVWASVSAPGAGGITLVNRVGIRLYVTVGLGGAPSSNFVIGRLEAKRSETGEPLVVAQIRNSGQRALDISGTLTLSNGPGGLSAGPFPVRLGTALAPNDSEPTTVRLDKQLPRGPWRAHLQLRSGLVQRAAVATITFPRVAPAGSGHVILVGILLGFVSAVGVALLLTRRSALLRRRRVAALRQA
jgi:hypothetical protein